MKILNISAAFFLLFVSFMSLNATTINVPSVQPDIQSGIDAAGNLDTVLVAPGTYRVNLNFKGKSITVTSEAGPLLTILKPYSTSLPIVTFENSESPLAVLEGFTLKERYSKPAVQIYNSSPVVRDNIFTHNDSYFGGGIVYIRGNSSCTIQRNLFYNNPSGYVIIWEDSESPTWILNNTIDGGRQGICLWGSMTTAYGNTVTNCNSGISAVSNANTAYNNVWGNGTDWSFGTAGPADVTLNPSFVNPAVGDYSLSENSLLIDFGNPNVNYNDPDGTRNDIGAIPFDQRAPLAINLHLDSYEVTNILEHYPTFIWSFYDPSPTQTAFEIEVGIDKNWTTAESWSSGEVTSPDTFVTYNGLPLDNGSVNYYRVRVNNGTEWGIWSESVFRINSIPTTPVLLSPINQDVISMFGVRLSIENSIDAEGDDLTYDFEIYSDAGMAILIESIEDLPEYNDITITDKISNLDANTEYWWRSRANDSYENSPWSDLSSFVTRAPLVLTVPAEYETLQVGINTAEEQDTVLVAAGTYAGEGNRDLSFNGKNIILISESGPDVTIIDCGGEPESYQGFIFDNDEDSTSVVDGFTITNSYTPMTWNEGAINCQDSPTIKNCRISGNLGDGILCSFGAAPKILDCIISDNTGTGVRCGWSDLTMNGCLVYGNDENGLHVNYGAMKISNCTFAYNAGAGLFLEGDPPKMKVRAEDSAMVNNCIMAFNEGGGVKQWFNFYPSLRMECNNAFGNNGDDWSVYIYNVDDEYGNISDDPLFCDYENNNFGIANISPCAPDNNECAVLIGAKDIDCTMTAIEDNTVADQLPESYVLDQNYPNPFNPTTQIKYSLPKQSNVKMVVVNVLGQNVCTLVDSEQAAGEYSVYWYGTDENNNRVTSGIYLYKIITDEFILSRKMILLK
ncbi:MAG: T9SS type A sorting domain-containing protein [candidate division Zixibacteria bacterium]|nr:T9SS type A sorting domain-containing protein [candidate division Zixibacteria bacterium]